MIGNLKKQANGIDSKEGRKEAIMKYGVLLLLVILASVLTGCSSKYGCLRSRNAVEKYVKEQVPVEEYELVDIIKDDTKRPRSEDIRPRQHILD
ncbi:MAG: hypothetical protein K6G27_14480 [Lachnospiraceae bacterium]|nr:hypothetical protein [Lachnospiraceae bacterium]